LPIWKFENGAPLSHPARSSEQSEVNPGHFNFVNF